ncbi:MAG TPA: AraC family transcriptional regulator [Mycobacteriales bacterium]|nr:AraC family transcriptional regulator [Mycobacteriales bacterium]
MDVLSDLLTRSRARQGVFARSVVDPPWALEFRDGAPLALEMVVRGRAWLTAGVAEPIRLDAGDVALVTGGIAYVIGDRPSTAPGAVVYGPGRVAAADETAAAADDRWRRPGTRTYGSSAASHTDLVRSAYPATGRVAWRLLDALPPVLRVPAGAIPPAARDLMNSQIDVAAPGQQAILDRLLDLLVVVAIRAWFEGPEGRAPGWYGALKDPLIGRALTAIHRAPEHRWTVASLAAEAGLSRAAFARRFRGLTGQSPIGYLTSWRMDLAGDLLRESDSTVDTVARRVGYGDAFSFSSAFRRDRGMSPTAFRRTSGQ